MLDNVERSWLVLFHTIITIIIVVFGLSYLMTGSVSNSLDNVANSPRIVRNDAIRVGTKINDRITQPIFNAVDNDMNI